MKSTTTSFIFLAFICLEMVSCKKGENNTVVGDRQSVLSVLQEFFNEEAMSELAELADS